jgi:hypothetical protein
MLLELIWSTEFPEDNERKFRDLAVDQAVDFQFDGAEYVPGTEEPADWLDAENILPLEEHESFEVINTERDGQQKKQNFRALKDFLKTWSGALDILLDLPDHHPKLLTTPSDGLEYAPLWEEWIRVSHMH